MRAATRSAGATSPRHLLLPLLVALASLDDATRRPVPLSLSRAHSSPLPRSLSPRPSAAVTAVRHSRSHRLPLASPTSPRALPHLPLPLRQATRCRTPCGAAVAIVFLLGRRRPPTPIRRLQRLPEPTGLLSNSAVSSHLESPSPPCLLHAAAAIPVEAELRPPQTSSPALLPATPAPATATVGCATPPSSRSCASRAKRRPVGQTRGSPPRLASPAAKRR